MIKGQEKLLFSNLMFPCFTLKKKIFYYLNVKAEYPSKASTVNVTGREGNILGKGQY